MVHDDRQFRPVGDGCTVALAFGYAYRSVCVSVRAPDGWERSRNLNDLPHRRWRWLPWRWFQMLVLADQIPIAVRALKKDVLSGMVERSIRVAWNEAGDETADRSVEYR